MSDLFERHPVQSTRWHPFEGRVIVEKHDPNALLVEGRPEGVLVVAPDGITVLTGVRQLFLTRGEAEAERQRVIGKADRALRREIEAIQDPRIRKECLDAF